MYEAKAKELATVTLRINGRNYRAAIEPRLLLSDFLREQCGLTGTHIGCEHGVCGSCTILVDGVATRSCLTLAIASQGCEIITIEGLVQQPAFNKIYQAFTENHALQCGFCTPGIVATAMAEVVGEERSTEEITDLLGGHLCRCTGYVGIKAALQELATPMQEQALEE